MSEIGQKLDNIGLLIQKTNKLPSINSFIKIVQEHPALLDDADIRGRIFDYMASKDIKPADKARLMKLNPKIFKKLELKYKPAKRPNRDLQLQFYKKNII
jgi:hypothetical protein